MRKQRPHPGAQLRFTDADGMRPTCFATSTKDIAVAQLELRHRQRARAEDRIRAARATGLRNLPLHDAAQNQSWLEIVRIALELLAWMPQPAVDGCDHRRPDTAGSPPQPRLNSRVPSLRAAPLRPEPWNQAPTRRDSRAPALPANSQQAETARQLD
ncbi:hypothetical protein GCM10023083_12750 [Streptomyces phyllanthi]